MPRDDELAHLRDRALLGLLGLGTVEITRANFHNLMRRDDEWDLMVRGKDHARVIYLAQASG